MPDFDFEHLDDKNFERMAASLCAEHVARGLRIFGTGTDGGREATFEGKAIYPSLTAPWDGYIVVQCKQKQSRGATPKDEADWAIGQLNTEMAKYETAKRKRQIPEYFLFITNAQLSAQLDTGGKDRFVERLNYWVTRLGMKKADVWDRDKLNNLVDLTPKVAQRFGLLHSGNLIHYAAHALLSHQEGVETTLSVFLQEELRADQFVLLAQTDDRPPLARVFMDLRARSIVDPKNTLLVVQEVQQTTDRPLPPSLLKEEHQALFYATRAAFEEEPELDEVSLLVEAEEELRMVESLAASLPLVPYSPARYVIVGGPGQGKSTLGQQLAQRHRAALLRADTSKTLEAEIERTLRIIEMAADEVGTGLPTYPRWPFRIALQDFAGALATAAVDSILDYMALLVRKRTKRAFTAQDAERLLSSSPLFVVLDGLDEVPAVSNRTQVLDAVRRFLLEARDKDADLLVLATTRPQGYEDEFEEFEFTQFTLQLLTQKEALAYARKLLEVKYAMDTDRQERLLGRMEAAAREPAIMRLMMSPLQITIMATLVDVVGILPRERYLLFERYYEIIYQREQERGLTLSQVLADYRTTIEILHDRIGLLLQVEAESQGRTDSRILGERLQRMVRAYLVQEEYSGEELTRLTSNFMDIALHRLVFIVPLEDERYGFEVRSLQEFSAARALMRGDYAVVKERLRAIAPVPYWRNTLLFAVGQAFARQNTQHRDLVLQLCRELDDADDMVLYRTHAGARLALAILEDGIVALQPKYRNQVLAVALQLLRFPHVDTANHLAQLYVSRDQEAFQQAIQAVMGSSSFDESVGVFVLLARLEGRDDAPWAEVLLQRYWPAPLAQQQLLLEIPVNYESSDWFNGVFERIVKASKLEWARDHLPRYGSRIGWIEQMTRWHVGRQQEVRLASEGSEFYFSSILKPMSAELLHSLPDNKAWQYDWLPLTVGHAFMLNPSPATLADALEALVEAGWQPDREYEYLPWQLEALLTNTASPEELLHHAQRARNGELGSTQDWLAAESRWLEHPVTIEDLTCFSDADWPYTAAIAQRGFLPVGYFGLDNTRNSASANLLLQAALQAPSARYRVYLSVGFLFAAGHSYDPDKPFTIPIATLEQLVHATPWHVFGLTVIGLLGADTDWVGEVKAVDSIGQRISILGNPENLRSALPRKQTQAAVAQLVPLVGTQHVREGILRLLATLAVAGIEVPVLALDPASCSAEGQIALATLNLLGKEPQLNVAALTQLVLELWTHPHPRTGVCEMQRVLQRACERKGLPHTPTTLAVFNNLSTATALSPQVKLDILDCLMQQLQFRTSGLADAAQQGELATEWLVEVLHH